MMRISATRLFPYLLPVAMLGMSPAWADADVYDKPLAIKKVHLPRDPQDPSGKRELACYSYPAYTIKQLDFGEVGAERLSVLPAVDGKVAPCRQAKESDEYVLPPEMWSGYFAGAKAEYAFFTASDGVNGGMGFIVVRLADKKKLFEDVYEKNFSSITLRDGVPLLHYRRVHAADCSAVTDGVTCMQAIARATGVAQASLAMCAKGYKSAAESLARERCKADGKNDAACLARELAVIRKQKWDASPSVVVYEVETDLHESAAPDRPLPGPSIKPLGDALSCRPAD